MGDEDFPKYKTNPLAIIKTVTIADKQSEAALYASQSNRKNNSDFKFIMQIHTH